MNPITWIVAIGLILLIAGINLGLLMALRRGNIHNQFESLSRAVQRLRHPWQEEDEQLKELSRRVTELQAHAAPTTEQENPPSKIG